MDKSTTTTNLGASGKVDRRVLRTRRAIKSAFDRLLTEKGIDKITVSAIAREADIDRKTFYLHYATIDDLIRDIAADNIREIEELLAAEGEGKSIEECVRLVLREVDRTIMDNIPRYRSIATGLSIDQILEHVESNGQLLLDLISISEYQEMFKENPDQFHMQLRFYLAGALSLYTEWLVSDQKMPIEEVSRVVEAAFVANLLAPSYLIA